VGYRHIDTAAVYRNEADVGAALRASGVSRDQVWITTKLWNDDQGAHTTRSAFEASLKSLGIGHVDLYLLHWPHSLRLESWRVLEELYDEGLARAIGVSNFLAPHLDELLAVARIRPAANQIELTPFLYRTRREIVQRCRDENVAIEAYSPLTKGRRLDDATVRRSAADVGRTPAQVLIRWAIEKGLVVLPRSSNPGRIAENAQVFDFTLGRDRMATLDALDEGLTTGWDPARTA
jgi:diketogulonate reductase-like aldo/keto reductase